MLLLSDTVEQKLLNTEEDESHFKVTEYMESVSGMFVSRKVRPRTCRDSWDAFIVPVPFCAMRFFNDARYLDGTEGAEKNSDFG